MKKINLACVILPFFFSLQWVYAEQCKTDLQTQNECCEIIKTNQLTKIYRFEANDKKCTLSIYNSDMTKSYRRFVFGEDGRITIIIEPNGNESKANSTQSYFLFPLGKRVYPYFDSKGNMTIQSGSGQNWKINSSMSTPVSVEDCQVDVSSKFSLHESGFKIKSCEKHLLIETKVEVGGDYIAYPDKTLIVRDPRGQTCEIKNSDLYTYEKKGKERKEYMDSKGRYHNQTFRYTTNKELGVALKKICPNIDVSMLLKTEPAPRKIDPEEEKKALDILEGRK